MISLKKFESDLEELRSSIAIVESGLQRAYMRLDLIQSHVRNIKESLGVPMDSLVEFVAWNLAVDIYGIEKPEVTEVLTDFYFLPKSQQQLVDRSLAQALLNLSARSDDYNAFLTGSKSLVANQISQYTRAA